MPPLPQTLAHEETPEAAVERLERTVRLLQERITQLEEENAAFAARLKEHGVDVQASSRVALELPPPLRAPAATVAGVRALLSAAEQKLLDDVRAEETVLLLLRSETAADTGAWLKRARLWVAVTPAHVLLLAHGRRPFFQKTPCTRLRQSLYNHVTGELALAPALELKVERLRLAPADGYQVLAQIYG